MGRAGDRRDEEFRTFAADTRASLLRTATMLTAGDTHLAEDLVQITLSKVYVAWPRVRDVASAGAYARTVLTRAFVDHTRRPWWRREQPAEEVPEIVVEDAGPGEDHTRLDAALRALPPRMRAIVVLRYWLDLDVATTAAQLGCSPGTVRGQASRALAVLRRVLSDAGDDLAATRKAIR